MSFDQRIWLLAKYVIWLGIFLVVMMPVSLVWLLIFPFVKVFKKKQEVKTGVYIDINAWTPMEAFMTYSRKWLGLD